MLFDRWCSACTADDLTSVRELMLLEEFKDCLPERVVIYLNEQRVATLQQAAYLADEFALTHKSVFVKGDSFTHDDLEPPTDVPVTQAFVQQLDGRVEKLCFFCHQPGHLVADCVALKCRQQASALRWPKGVGLIKTVSLVGQPNVSRHDARW